MNGINLAAVLAAAASALVLGGIWYSPALFASAWMRAAGIADAAPRPGARVFGGAFALSLIAAFVFAMFLGPAPALKLAIGAGFAAGLCWVAAAMGMNYLFERRPLRLFLINGGYFTLQFTLYGLVLGLWH
jgi:hypothetical protein